MGNDGTDKVLEIYMLGGLEIRWQGKQIFLGKGLGSKQLRLLLILLHSRENGIRRENLLEQLYMDSDVEQASNSLRAMVFRLRRSLVAAGLPKGEYIITRGGIYQWHSDQVRVVLDVEEFQRKAEEALAVRVGKTAWAEPVVMAGETTAWQEAEPGAGDTASRQKREPGAGDTASRQGAEPGIGKSALYQTQLLEEACRMYRGEFLPTMIADGWVAEANWKYQELYFRCLRLLGRHLRAQQRYQELLGYCEQAIAIYPYEEWQILKMECLAGMREYGAAMDYYEQVAEECRTEFGMVPSEQMTEVYRSIRGQIQYETRNLEEIRAQMESGPRRQGASQCDYLTFVDIYQYMVWVLERKGIQAQLVLFTLVDRKGVPLELSPLLEQSRECLEQAISDSVRKADLFTCCGKNQFLVLMVGTDEEGCDQAVRRIRMHFQERNHSRRVELYDTREMAGSNV